MCLVSSALLIGLFGCSNEVTTPNGGVNTGEHCADTHGKAACFLMLHRRRTSELMHLWLLVFIAVAVVTSCLLTPQAVDSARPATPEAGAEVAFVSNRDGAFEIYLMNADGTDPRRLTQNGGSGPCWNPDGSRICFSRSGDIYVMDATGDNEIRLTTDPTLIEIETTWSPDYTTIAYTSWDPSVGTDIYVMDADGTNQHDLVPGIQLDFNPDWSPDEASLLLFQKLSVHPLLNAGVLLGR